MLIFQTFPIFPKKDEKIYTNLQRKEFFQTRMAVID